MESPPISEVNKIENKISPSILPIIVVLAAIFFISGILHILVRHLLRQQQQQQQQANRDEDEADQSRNVTAFQGRLQQLFHLHDCGVDQSFIDCLPVFLYKAIIGLRVDPFDCAVCLCEFEPDDKLRLIPMCSHAFHVECIDTWLLSHSTCPLCRSSLLSEDFASNSLALAVLESAAESSRYSFSSLSSALDNTIGHDDKVAENEAEDKVVQVKLGKFRNADVGSVIEGSGDTGDQKLDQRRCFSLGSYEYVMNETSLLRVAVKPPKKRQVAMSECGAKAFDECSSKSLEPRKKESFSVSKIWLRSGAKEKYGNGESSRRALSFRLPLHYDQSKGKSAEVGGLESEKDVDVEVGSCNNSVVSVESQISQTPSFARRTLMWVVNRQNRVGSYL